MSVGPGCCRSLKSKYFRYVHGIWCGDAQFSDADR